MRDRIEILRNNQLFKDLPAHALREVAAKMKEAKFKTNQTIIRAGEKGHCMYLIKSGQVKIVKGLVLGYLGRGEYFGEMSLLTGTDRSAEVIATLDTTLYVLSERAFDNLTVKYPAIAIALSRVLAKRLAKQYLPKSTRQHPPGLITFCTPLAAATQKKIAYSLARAIKQESNKKTIFLDFNFSAPSVFSLIPARKKNISKELLEEPESCSAAQLQKQIPRHNGLGILCIDNKSADYLAAFPRRLSALIGLLKESFDFIIIDCGSSRASGRRRDNLLLSKCLEYSDSIIYFAEDVEAIDSANQFIQKNIRLLSKIEVMAQNILGASPEGIRKIYAELVKEPVYRLSLEPAESRALLEKALIPKDLRRVARRISGVSLGVAIGSGGVKACAGIGLLAALEEENIPVDIIAGSSGGGAVAFLHGLGKSIRENIRFNKIIGSQRFAPNPFPLGSLFTSQNLITKAKELLNREEVYLEELKLPTFIAITDLLSGQPVSFGSGPASTLIPATLALPAILNPIKYKNFLLIDGGVSDVVPGEVLIKEKARITIGMVMHGIQADDPEKELELLQLQNPLINLLKNIPFINKSAEIPPLTEIINRSILIPNLMLNEFKMEYFDFLLKPRVLHYHLLDYKAINTIFEEGKRESYKIIPALKRRLKEIRS